MSTGDKKTSIYLKKFLPQQQMVDNFLEYLVKRDEENLKLQYPEQGYFFGNSMAGSGPDEITAATPSLATDGLGHLMKLDPSQASAKFENNLGDTYYVGMRYNVREKDTEVNVRTGQIEYTFLEDAIGEKGEPDVVIDNGSTLRLEVDGLFELGVSHAGRQAVVYLKRAVGQADAFYTGLVTFVAGKNVIDTTHLIGQTAGLVSTDPSDYWVFIPGLTIRKFDIRVDPNYVFLGTVTGVGAGNTPTLGDIDTSEANVLYDGGSFTTIVNTLRSFLVGGGSIAWDLANEELTLGANLHLKPASVPYNYQIDAGAFSPIADGDCGYIELDGIGGSKAVVIAALSAVPDDPKYQPIFYREGNNIHFWMGSLELEGDASSVTTGRIDGVTEDLLSYIGAANESDADPDYTNATGAPKENIHLTDGESLTRAIKKLELRNDVVVKVRAIDLLSTVLPAGPTVTIDGQSIANGQMVLFANPLINKVYRASNIGVSVVWTEMQVFGGLAAPASMSLVAVQDSSNEFIRNIWQYTSLAGWKPYNLSEVMSEPTGFTDQDESEMLFDDGTRTFTVQPKAPATEFYYFQKGRVFKVNGPKTVVIPDSEGVHYIYFDGVNLLSSQSILNDYLKDLVIVASVYWDAINNVSIVFTENRHALTMDGKTHEYLHNTVGMRWVSGLGLTYVPGTGALDADAQVAVGDGLLYDEDIAITPTDDPAPSDRFEQILDPIAELPIFYKEGAAGDWRKFTANQFPAKLGAARLQYNNPAGPWTLVDAPNNGDHVAAWIFASNDVRHPIFALMGQRVDTLLNDALANNLYEALDLGNLPSNELKVLYRVIFQTDATYANSIKARIVDVRDLRKAVDTSIGQYAPSAHNNLAARNAANAHPASSISTVLTNFLGALSADDDEVQKALVTLDDHFKALRIKEHPSNKQRVVVTGASVTLSTGTVLEQQIRNLIVSFDGIEIDFQTGEIFESDGVTPYNGGLNDFTPVIPPVGENRWAALTLLPSTVNPDNTINLQPLVLISNQNNFRAVFASGIKVGQIKVEEDSGGVADIFQAAITQQGVGGGGGGSGTGDANSFLEDLKAFLRSSSYQWMTPNILSISETALTDLVNTTALYDVANSLFEIDLGQTFRSTQLLGARFLADEAADVAEVDLQLQYDLTGVDADPDVFVSRNGGNEWQQVTMNRIGTSDKYQGSHTFSDEASDQNLYVYLNTNADTSISLNATTTKAIAQPIVATEKDKVKKITLYVEKSGTPVGNIIFKVVKDTAGSPSSDPNDLMFSKIVNASSISGITTIPMDSDIIFVNGQTYWIVVETDDLYKTNNHAINVLQLRADSTPSITVAKAYNSSWTAASYAAVYLVQGFKFDLRVRIDASMNDTKLKGFGIFFAKQQAGVPVGDTPEVYRYSFSGDANEYSFTLPFTPDPDFLEVWDVGAGNVYSYPAFDIAGNVVNFLPGTFLSPGETVQLKFKQGSGFFDNSDLNRNLLAANHLGSTSGSNTLQSPGRGIMLADEANSLKEIAIDSDSGLRILNPSTLEVVDYHYGAADNGLYNSDFFYTQRNEAKTYSVHGSAYLADRWIRNNGGNVNAANFTQVVSNPASSVVSSMRMGRVSGSSDVNTVYLVQSLTTKDSIKYAGKTVCLSFLLKKGANFSGANFRATLFTGTGVDQAAISAWTGAVSNVIMSPASASISTSIFQKFYAVAQIPSNATQLGIRLDYTPVGTAGAADYMEISQVMFNEGRGPAKWSLKGKDYGGELIKCMAFYEKSYNQGVSPGTATDVGSRNAQRVRDTITDTFGNPFMVPKRAVPAVQIYSPATGSASVVRDRSAGSDRGATTIYIGQTGFSIDASVLAGNPHNWHYVADAEL